jgi:hypothetical protein
MAKDRDIQDPNARAGHTVKLYESEKVCFDDGTWRHRRITLEPSSSDCRMQGLYTPGFDLAPAGRRGCIRHSWCPSRNDQGPSGR